MTMQSMLRDRNMSMYRLSKISGVPKTTVIDICSGKSSIEGCNAKTVLQLSKALGCSMEELMSIDAEQYEKPDQETLAAIEEARRIAADSAVQGYHTNEELKKALDV